MLDQREGNLWMAAGMVTSQTDRSLDFDIGMNFFEWHALPDGLADRKGSTASCFDEGAPILPGIFTDD